MGSIYLVSMWNSKVTQVFGTGLLSHIKMMPGRLVRAPRKPIIYPEAETLSTSIYNMKCTKQSFSPSHLRISVFNCPTVLAAPRNSPLFNFSQPGSEIPA